MRVTEKENWVRNADVNGAPHINVNPDGIMSEYVIGVHNGTGDSAERKSEIARLIATAPDLLEALKAVLMWHRGYGTKTQAEIVREYIEPAIKKATGA
jgi:hypothetical protein